MGERALGRLGAGSGGEVGRKKGSLGERRERVGKRKSQPHFPLHSPDRYAARPEAEEKAATQI